MLPEHEIKIVRNAIEWYQKELKTGHVEHINERMRLSKLHDKLEHLLSTSG